MDFLLFIFFAVRVLSRKARNQFFTEVTYHKTFCRMRHHINIRDANCYSVPVDDRRRSELPWHSKYRSKQTTFKGMRSRHVMYLSRPSDVQLLSYTYIPLPVPVLPYVQSEISHKEFSKYETFINKKKNTRYNGLNIAVCVCEFCRCWCT
jgi:hypothetical protein